MRWRVLTVRSSGSWGGGSPLRYPSPGFLRRKMRKLVVGALMGALSLVVAAVAIGASATSGTTVQNFEQTYTAKKPSKSTGTSFATSSTDEQNARNKQPKR